VQILRGRSVQGYGTSDRIGRVLPRRLLQHREGCCCGRTQGMTKKISCNFSDAFELVTATITIIELEASRSMLEDDKNKIFEILTEAFDDMKKHLKRIDPIMKRNLNAGNN
jgi:hypothetical protein